MIDYNRKLSNVRETQVSSQRMSILVLLYENIKHQFYAVLFCLFDSLRPINNLSVKQGGVFLG